MLGFIVAAVISYVLGSIPNGLLLGKGIWGVDLRQHGSGNIGATNAWRTIGKAGGFSIFFLDMLKGAISAYLGLHLGGSELAGIICGLLAIVGHSWSIFLGFKGGGTSPTESVPQHHISTLRSSMTTRLIRSTTISTTRATVWASATDLRPSASSPARWKSTIPLSRPSPPYVRAT